MAAGEEGTEGWTSQREDFCQTIADIQEMHASDMDQDDEPGGGHVKSEPPSPDDGIKNYEDTDLDSSDPKQHRRFAHSVAEQKRRNAIRKGYDDLQTIVPLLSNQNGASSSQKPSKAVILQKTIDYIGYMIQERKKHDKELEKLKKDVMAFRIMKANYESIAMAHQNQPVPGQQAVPDQIKFSVFKQIMEKQFATFNSSVNATDFDNLSSGTFNWLEEYCQPQFFTESVLGSLRNLSEQGLLQS